MVPIVFRDSDFNGDRTRKQIMPIIILPDGSQRAFDRPVTVHEVAANIDASLAIVTERDAEGRDVIRHSCAHLLAQAVKQLFPEAQVTIGPVIADGFYYDFSFKRPITPEDLAAIEMRMHELAAADQKVTRTLMSREQAMQLFAEIGEEYKRKIIEDIPSVEPLSFYKQGEFIDLCRGPHVPSTGKMKAFKLMKVAGAYWRGDSRNEMLQRIYGTAWGDKKALDAYLHRLEEAEKRDHRKIAKAQDLFHTQEEAPGMVFWHPNGWTVWQVVEQYMRCVFRDNGYQEIRTPQVMDRVVWEKSGHWENYRENMFTTQAEARDFAVKPMNCPGHIQVFNQGLN